MTASPEPQSIPPFTVLDSRQGYWQQRRRAWLALGIQPDLGRPNTMIFAKERTAAHGLHFYRKQSHDGDRTAPPEPRAAWRGTSAFDPVLCELAYRWFCPPGGAVLDPFAGGAVRGAVAAALGYAYTGIDLRAEQITANRAQWQDIAPRLPDAPAPAWHTGDSAALLADPALRHPNGYDLLFSCPPYAGLERYSDDPRDLSTMPYDRFLAAYREIISRASTLLAPDRFAVWAVSEVRDQRTGLYRGLVPETVRAFGDVGLDYYNEAVLVKHAGSLPVRAPLMFRAARKLGRQHQQVLVFVNGDPRRATEACRADVAAPVWAGGAGHA